eukprot:520877_1
MAQRRSKRIANRNSKTSNDKSKTPNDKQSKQTKPSTQVQTNSSVEKQLHPNAPRKSSATKPIIPMPVPDTAPVAEEPAQEEAEPGQSAVPLSPRQRKKQKRDTGQSAQLNARRRARDPNDLSQTQQQDAAIHLLNQNTSVVLPINDDTDYLLTGFTHKLADLVNFRKEVQYLIFQRERFRNQNVAEFYFKVVLGFNINYKIALQLQQREFAAIEEKSADHDVDVFIRNENQIDNRWTFMFLWDMLRKVIKDKTETDYFDWMNHFVCDSLHFQLVADMAVWKIDIDAVNAYKVLIDVLIAMRVINSFLTHKINKTPYIFKDFRHPITNATVTVLAPARNEFTAAHAINGKTMQVAGYPCSTLFVSNLWSMTSINPLVKQNIAYSLSLFFRMTVDPNAIDLRPSDWMNHHTQAFKPRNSALVVMPGIITDIELNRALAVAENYEFGRHLRIDFATTRKVVLRGNLIPNPDKQLYIPLRDKHCGDMSRLFDQPTFQFGKINEVLSDLADTVPDMAIEQNSNRIKCVIDKIINSSATAIWDFNGHKKEIQIYRKSCDYDRDDVSPTGCLFPGAVVECTLTRDTIGNKLKGVDMIVIAPNRPTDLQSWIKCKIKDDRWMKFWRNKLHNKYKPSASDESDEKWSQNDNMRAHRFARFGDDRGRGRGQRGRGRGGIRGRGGAMGGGMRGRQGGRGRWGGRQNDNRDPHFMNNNNNNRSNIQRGNRSESVPVRSNVPPVHDRPQRLNYKQYAIECFKAMKIYFQRYNNSEDGQNGVRACDIMITNANRSIHPISTFEDLVQLGFNVDWHWMRQVINAELFNMQTAIRVDLSLYNPAINALRSSVSVSNPSATSVMEIDET